MRRNGPLWDEYVSKLERAGIVGSPSPGHAPLSESSVESADSRPSRISMPDTHLEQTLDKMNSITSQKEITRDEIATLLSEVEEVLLSDLPRGTQAAPHHPPPQSSQPVDQPNRLPNQAGMQWYSIYYGWCLYYQQLYLQAQQRQQQGVRPTKSLDQRNPRPHRPEGPSRTNVAAGTPGRSVGTETEETDVETQLRLLKKQQAQIKKQIELLENARAPAKTKPRSGSARVNQSRAKKENAAKPTRRSVSRSSDESFQVVEPSAPREKSVYERKRDEIAKQRPSWRF
ncbi:hypothetical protein ADEAN_000238300 [Angomonas deanei]|uniref:Uncharacterized protein n=1 Tax=Angomonas deanei TaxID=59799 RepID=A0A7G2C5D3_9TRYP|nr:hypothetical protein ADEAN_000238300 [Angomonas deanei]